MVRLDTRVTVETRRAALAAAKSDGLGLAAWVRRAIALALGPE